jgi:hypothetical protein
MDVTQPKTRIDTRKISRRDKSIRIGALQEKLRVPCQRRKGREEKMCPKRHERK